LNAPRNWVQKNGAKRFCVNKENWLGWLIRWLAKVMGLAHTNRYWRERL
jgi:hypothetical protein